MYKQLYEKKYKECLLITPGCITPEYVFRMWGGTVPLEEIEAAMKLIRN